MSPDGGYQLLDKEGQENGADGGQVKVVNHKRTVELESRPLAHQLSSAKDDDVVGEDREAGLAHRRQRRLVRLEVKVLWVEAHDHGKGLVKERPEMDAKRPVDAGNR